MQPYTPADFARAPLMLYFETTQACDLVCDHCRASAQKEAAPDQLSAEQAARLIDQIAAFPRKPTLVFTGGDPLKRPDLFDLIARARSHGLQVALTPSATPLATHEALAEAKAAGVSRLGISLDGPDALTHDGFRGWCGSFERTLEMLGSAARLGLPVQVNTTICRRNFERIDDIAELLSDKRIAMWAAFFLVPVGRGLQLERLTAEECEVAFEKLWRHAQRQPYAVKTTEAPHYRRYVLKAGGHPHAAKPARGDADAARRGHRAPLGVTDGKGVMFVGHNGEIYPAGFLPLKCGAAPEDNIVDVYQKHPTFLALRDPDRLKGICGRCEYRRVCGGSRARAYAVTGDPLAAEPDCAYRPRPEAEVMAEH